MKHAAIFDGEEYDAREVPGFENLQALGTPEKNTEFSGEILPSDGAEIYLRHDLALKPKLAYAWKGVTGESENAYGKIVITKEFQPDQEIVLPAGETLVVDFGQNAAAVPSFVFSAKAGTKLTCLPSELLNDGNGAKERGMDGPEGSCHRTNLRMQDTGMILDYTFADNKDYASFTPHNTFFGYRFISVTATDEVKIKQLESIPVTSITKEMETGTITTGNPSINQLISNTIWGQRSNYLSVPTDCPQRNERLGWTADTQVFSETGTFFANTNKFFHKWMRDMRDTQHELGGYPGVAPVAQYGAAPIHSPIASTQVVPIVDCFRLDETLSVLVMVEYAATATFKRFVAQPVAPLVIAILVAVDVMVIFRFIKMVEVFLHGNPTLIDDLLVVKLLPNDPRHNDTGIRPA